MTSRFGRAAVLPLVVACGLAGCGGQDASAPAGDPSPATGSAVITVRSSAFGEGEPIPARFSCDGAQVSPPLTWQGVPAGTPALALVVDDPDAPGGRFLHWIVTDIAAAATGTAEGAVPDGGQQIGNDGGRPGWTGPCPPSGSHHYRFTVYALRARLSLPQNASGPEAVAAVARAATASGRLTGTYHRG